jgi:LSD1 subclass zinc finger protein
MSKVKRFFYNASIKFQRFMAGRYGTDSLYKALLVFYLIGIILCSIVYRFSKISYYALWVLATAILIFAVFRVFSKNIPARRKENENWLKFTGKISRNTRLNKDKFNQRKTHKFVKCKSCKSVLRLPKHRGKINVTCPHCQKQFIINTGKKK